ncbi:MAG TPA: RES domain-containing protein [Solirubrobacteraceae bacterium]|nr:RES domain-containing protein [Solirubrobacteraceae bacterium]
MILWRLLAWRRESSPTQPGGALWFPRELQGLGRHDNPDRYGCVYASEFAVSAVAEALAPFRGTGRLMPGMLVRAGMELALVRLDLEGEDVLVDPGDGATVGGTARSGGSIGRERVGTHAEVGEGGRMVDLDDPRVLEANGLRPSGVATRARTVTQAYAGRLFEEYPAGLGLRWWSTLEASLINVTIFDRAAPHLAVAGIEALTLEHPAVLGAADLLGLTAEGRG